MATKKKADTTKTVNAPYPRHTIEKCIRIPQVILDQNAGKACARNKVAEFLGVGLSGELNVEFSSAIKYGLLDKDGADVKPSDLAKQILRPQSDSDELEGYRNALFSAPQFGDVYQHYRGENLPESRFFENALVDNFKVPREKVAEFISILMTNLRKAELVKEHDDKIRLIDVGASAVEDQDKTIQKLAKKVDIVSGDSCFVMMPFADPIGGYYNLVYKPAIEKTGLRPIRADADIFGSGKIMDQILEGMTAAKVLVAELTDRNPNVFYELGIAHALKKPVVLVSATEKDVPFDLQHIRVIYYDVKDPFWGTKLIEKVAENVLSAIQRPDEAILKLPN